mmetsp:Transcript_816/g.2363  ORF Transcript_816/g.2363 Transcript_816/m.2363 type:complete len:101 (+) Transcript_816:2271-2573(+)
MLVLPQKLAPRRANEISEPAQWLRRSIYKLPHRCVRKSRDLNPAKQFFHCQNKTEFPSSQEAFIQLTSFLASIAALTLITASSLPTTSFPFVCPHLFGST